MLFSNQTLELEKQEDKWVEMVMGVAVGYSPDFAYELSCAHLPRAAWALSQ